MSSLPDCLICCCQTSAATQLRIVSCGHDSFCEACLLRWCQTQPAALCPLCKSAVGDRLQRNDGSELSVGDWLAAAGPAKAADEADAPQLDCLAHADLVPDIARLLSSASNRCQQLASEQPKRRSRSGALLWHSEAERLAHARLQDIVHQLADMLDDFRHMRTLFDPQRALEQLYAFEAEISAPLSHFAPVQAAAPKRYGADDYDDLPYDEY